MFVLVCSILPMPLQTTIFVLWMLQDLVPNVPQQFFSIPVEHSTSSKHDLASGYLNSHDIDHNEVTFDLPLGELQMQEKEASIPKHTSDFGCQVNTRGVQLMMKSTETQTNKSSLLPQQSRKVAQRL